MSEFSNGFHFNDVFQCEFLAFYLAEMFKDTLCRKITYYRTDSDNRLYSVSSLTQLAAYFGDKKFQLFGVFIDSSAAPWHTDSKYIYMSILNIIATE